MKYNIDKQIFYNTRRHVDWLIEKMNFTMSNDMEQTGIDVTTMEYDHSSIRFKKGISMRLVGSKKTTRDAGVTEPEVAGQPR